MKCRVQDSEGLQAVLETSELDALLATPGLGRMVRLLHSAPKSRPDCPLCGWTDARYHATGRVGCPLCYAVLPSLQNPG